MKRFTSRAIIPSLILLISHTTFGQDANKLSLSLDGGVGLFFGDVMGKEKPGNRLNTSFSGGLSYHSSEVWRFTAQFTQGVFSGGNGSLYYETTYLEPTIVAGYDLMSFFDKQSKLSIELEGGLGWNSFYATSYSQNNSVLAKVPNEGTYSNSPIGLFGGKLAYKLDDKIDLRLGYSQRLVYNNDWVDGIKSGEANDQYGLISVGVTYRLKSDIKKDEMKVKKREYETLVAENQQLKDEVEIAMAEHEANLKAKDETIAQLQSRIDSMESLPAVVTASDAAAMEREEALDGGIVENKYHVVIGSFSSQANAENYVSEKFDSERDKIRIIYVQDMKMYRVIYNSYDSFYDAKRDIEKLKDRVKGLWIVRF